MTGKSAFTLGVQAGDKAADGVVWPHYRRLRLLFDSIMTGSYSRDVSEFAPVLRIDGSIWHWDREGVDNVRISKKSSRATADVFMPTSVWQGKDEKTIRSYLGRQVSAAYELMSERLVASRLHCDRERLRDDVARVMKEFLA